MITELNFTHLTDTTEEQLLYSHLLYWVKIDNPEKMMERFRALFLHGFNYSDWQVQIALDRITAAPNAHQNFKLFFNRCCHILVNRWQSHAHEKYAVFEFFELLEQPITLPIAGPGRSNAVRRLRVLVRDFIGSEHYLKMRRMIEFMVGGEDAKASLAAQRPLATLIRRYPCLYTHCLLSEQSNSQQKQVIIEAQGQAQKQYEVDLSQFLTFELRRSRDSGRIIQPVKNPTLLSDQDLRYAVRHFVGKADAQGSYRDQSFRFASQLSYDASPKMFKKDLFEYLTSNKDTQFGGGRFQSQLYQFINKLPSDGQALNEFQLVRTCSQVLNFLVVEGPQRPNHFTFIDLLNNLGTTPTVGLLLKLVLVCKKVKPYLEKRFAILFRHYENHARSNVGWLVNCLENLNIAWSAHFGSTDFSFATQL
jgi:hypothetical protein